ncbi:MAG: phage virion morphogenesis protein [Deltaproteobacteria bacterium]|jgi:phage gpG-like protein|nr:phage virion morphogenesis protein [Deltaproteobacteria bacterium]
MAGIEIQLHTQAPQRLAEIRKQLAPDRIDRARRVVAQALKELTVGRFTAQADPWGNPWPPSQRVTGNQRKLDDYASAMAAWHQAVARWQSAPKKGRGKKPKRPSRPKYRSAVLREGRAGQTLLLTGRLRASFEVVKKGDETVLTVAGGGTATSAAGAHGSTSGLVYFPTHQFGRDGIPARPMLPIRNGGIDLPDSYRAELDDVLETWMRTIVP